MNRQVPWLRVFVEGVVIVGSILMAFGIEAWWEQRSEKTLELEVLEGLATDFERHVTALESERERADWELGRLALTLEVSGEEYTDTLRALQFASLVYALARGVVWNPSGGVLDALIASEGLELISHKPIQQALAAWQGMVEDALDNQVTMRTYAFAQIIPLLSANGIPMSRAMASVREAWPVALDSEASALRSYRWLRGNSEVHSMLGIKYAWTESGRRDIVAALTEAQYIIELIRAELGG